MFYCLFQYTLNYESLYAFAKFTRVKEVYHQRACTQWSARREASSRSESQSPGARLRSGLSSPRNSPASNAFDYSLDYSTLWISGCMLLNDLDIWVQVDLWHLTKCPGHLTIGYLTLWTPECGLLNTQGTWQFSLNLWIFDYRLDTRS